MYDIKFRRKVLEVKKREKLRNKEVAKRFDIGEATVIRWKRKLAPTLKRNKPAIKIDMEALKKDVEEHPDSYLHERAKRFKVSAMGISWALKRLGVSYKKNAKSSKGQSRRQTILPRKD
jgi:transposase